MSEEVYRKAYDDGIAEIRAFMSERDSILRRLIEIENQAAKLRCGAIVIGRLIGENVDNNPLLISERSRSSMTESIKLVVRGAGIPLSPMDVRDRLLEHGFNVDAYSQPLALIHIVLKHTRKRPMGYQKRTALYSMRYFRHWSTNQRRAQYPKLRPLLKPGSKR